jgi:hypothetical protein
MEQWPVWTESFRFEVTKLLHDAVERAFEKWADSVRNQGTEAAARVLAAMTGNEPEEPRPDASPLDSRWSEAALDSLRTTLTALRDEISSLVAGANEAPIYSPLTPPDHVGATSGAHSMDSADHISRSTPLPVTLPDPFSAETDVAADLQTRACPVCEHLSRFAFEFFSKWQYALFTDEQAQRNFAVELGFCPLHTWQFEAISSPVGTSVGHARLIEEVSRLLASAAQDPQKGRFPLQILRSSANCRVCRLQRQSEATYIRHLVSFVQSAAGRQTYARSQGPCLRHLGLLLAASSGESTAHFLLTEAARHFEEMAEDMQSFGMKTESLRRTLRNRDEEDAYRRALIHLVGTKANCVPWNNDGEI